MGLKLNGIRQLLVYTYGVNLLQNSIVKININTETLILVRWFGPEMNAEKTKSMFLYCHPKSRYFENMPHLKYLGTIITNQNLIPEEIKRRLNSGIAGYHSVKNLLSSRQLFKNVKIGIYKNYNCACGSAWVRNSVCDIKGGTKTESV
jgi:hypothetical protein